MADDDDGRWMTWAELAEARGITKHGATLLGRRHKWKRSKGNDGLARVFVPLSFTEPGERRPASAGDARAEAEALLAGVREAYAEALAQARDGHVIEVRLLQEALDRACAQAQESLQRLEVLEASVLAGKSKGRLARVLAAWRGQ